MTVTTLRKRTREAVRGATQAGGGRLQRIRGTAAERLGAARTRAAVSTGTLRDRGGKRLGTVRKRAGARVRDTRRAVGYRIAGERPPSTARRLGSLAAATAAGAVAAFFLDPVSGKRRRHVAKDKITSAFRGSRDRIARRGRYVRGRAVGAVQEARRGGTVQIPENDETLAHKVESEALGYAGIPSGRVNVNAERGVVILRGQVDSPDDSRRLEKLVREVDGVLGVENLIHAPGAGPPNRSER
jgi:osmotically-inducible protein OsmY